MKLFRLHIYVLISIMGINSFAQKIYNLEIKNLDNQPIFKKITYTKQFSNYTSINKELNKIYGSLIKEGYLTASIDSTTNDSLNYLAYLIIGTKYKWAKLAIDNKDEVLIRKLGYKGLFAPQKTFKYKAISEMLNKIIVYYENNGYPFTTAKLDSIIINQSTVYAKLKVEKNNLVKLDSLIVEGDAKINTLFLQRYLNVKSNMYYNEESFSSISRKVKQLAFITETKPPVLRMTEKSNKLYLFLNKKEASQFDGIIGIMPSEKGNTVITGDVKIKLVNSILKNGETIDLNWRRLQTQTQDLKAKIIYPYLLGLPIGIDYNIKIYKKDSTFIDVNNAIGLNYYFSGLNYLKVFYKQRNANLIATSGLSNATALPENADVITKSYGGWTFYRKVGL